MKEKESMILYRTQCKSLLKFPPEQRGVLFGQLVAFAFDEVKPTEFQDLASEVMFEQISEQITRDQEKYREKCNRNAQIAREREKAKKALQSKPEPTDANERIRTSTNSTDTDTGADTSTDTDTYTDTGSDTEGEQRAGNTRAPTREQIDSLYQEVCRKYGKTPRQCFVDRFMKYPHGDWKHDVDIWVQDDIKRGMYDKSKTANRFSNYEQSGLEEKYADENIQWANC